MSDSQIESIELGVYGEMAVDILDVEKRYAMENVKRMVKIEPPEVGDFDLTKEESNKQSGSVDEKPHLGVHNGDSLKVIDNETGNCVMEFDTVNYEASAYESCGDVNHVSQWNGSYSQSLERVLEMKSCDGVIQCSNRRKLDTACNCIDGKENIDAYGKQKSDDLKNGGEILKGKNGDLFSVAIMTKQFEQSSKRKTVQIERSHPKMQIMKRRLPGGNKRRRNRDKRQVSKTRVKNKRSKQNQKRQKNTNVGNFRGAVNAHCPSNTRFGKANGKDQKICGIRKPSQPRLSKSKKAMTHAKKSLNSNCSNESDVFEFMNKLPVPGNFMEVKKTQNMDEITQKFNEILHSAEMIAMKCSSEYLHPFVNIDDYLKQERLIFDRVYSQLYQCGAHSSGDGINNDTEDDDCAVIQNIDPIVGETGEVPKEMYAHITDTDTELEKECRENKFRSEVCVNELRNEEDLNELIRSQDSLNSVNTERRHNQLLECSEISKELQDPNLNSSRRTDHEHYVIPLAGGNQYGAKENASETIKIAEESAADDSMETDLAHNIVSSELEFEGKLAKNVAEEEKIISELEEAHSCDKREEIVIENVKRQIHLMNQFKQKTGKIFEDIRYDMGWALTLAVRLRSYEHKDKCLSQNEDRKQTMVSNRKAIEKMKANVITGMGEKIKNALGEIKKLPSQAQEIFTGKIVHMKTGIAAVNEQVIRTLQHILYCENGKKLNKKSNDDCNSCKKGELIGSLNATGKLPKKRPSEKEGHNIKRKKPKEQLSAIGRKVNLKNHRKCINYKGIDKGIDIRTKKAKEQMFAVWHKEAEWQKEVNSCLHSGDLFIAHQLPKFKVIAVHDWDEKIDKTEQQDLMEMNMQKKKNMRSSIPIILNRRKSQNPESHERVEGKDGVLKKKMESNKERNLTGQISNTVWRVEEPKIKAKKGYARTPSPPGFERKRSIFQNQRTRKEKTTLNTVYINSDKQSNMDGLPKKTGFSQFHQVQMKQLSSKYKNQKGEECLQPSVPSARDLGHHKLAIDKLAAQQESQIKAANSKVKTEELPDNETFVHNSLPQADEVNLQNQNLISSETVPVNSFPIDNHVLFKFSRLVKNKAGVQHAVFTPETGTLPNMLVPTMTDAHGQLFFIFPENSIHLEHPHIAQDMQSTSALQNSVYIDKEENQIQDGVLKLEPKVSLSVDEPYQEQFSPIPTAGQQPNDVAETITVKGQLMTESSPLEDGQEELQPKILNAFSIKTENDFQSFADNKKIAEVDEATCVSYNQFQNTCLYQDELTITISERIMKMALKDYVDQSNTVVCGMCSSVERANFSAALAKTLMSEVFSPKTDDSLVHGKLLSGDKTQSLIVETLNQLKLKLSFQAANRLLLHLKKMEQIDMSVVNMACMLDLLAFTKILHGRENPELDQVTKSAHAVQRYMGDGTWSWMCSVCGKRLYSYDSHARCHSGNLIHYDESIQCALCSWNFNSVFGLLSHYRWHCSKGHAKQSKWIVEKADSWAFGSSYTKIECHLCGYQGSRESYIYHMTDIHGTASNDSVIGKVKPGLEKPDISDMTTLSSGAAKSASNDPVFGKFKPGLKKPDIPDMTTLSSSASKSASNDPVFGKAKPGLEKPDISDMTTLSSDAAKSASNNPFIGKVAPGLKKSDIPDMTTLSYGASKSASNDPVKGMVKFWQVKPVTAAIAHGSENDVEKIIKMKDVSDNQDIFANLRRSELGYGRGHIQINVPTDGITQEMEDRVFVREMNKIIKSCSKSVQQKLQEIQQLGGSTANSVFKLVTDKMELEKRQSKLLAELRRRRLSSYKKDTPVEKSSSGDVIKGKQQEGSNLFEYELEAKQIFDKNVIEINVEDDSACGSNTNNETKAYVNNIQTTANSVKRPSDVKTSVVSKEKKVGKGNNLKSKGFEKKVKRKKGEGCNNQLGVGSLFKVITDPGYFDQIGSFDEIMKSMRGKRKHRYDRSVYDGKVQGSKEKCLKLDRVYSAAKVTSQPENFRELTHVSVVLERCRKKNTKWYSLNHR